MFCFVIQDEDVLQKVLNIEHKRKLEFTAIQDSPFSDTTNTNTMKVPFRLDMKTTYNF